MKIVEFIQNKFKARLKDSQVLVVYDAQNLYFDIVQSLRDHQTQVIDGSASTILGRFAAAKAWRELSVPEAATKQLVIYLPLKEPRSDEEKALDPYSLFAVAGSVFPESPAETYEALCKQAYPEYASEIDQLFRGMDKPAFAQIDALATGSKYPILQSTLKVEGALELLVAFITPSPEQTAALEGSTSWQTEMQTFCQAALGAPKQELGGIKAWHKFVSQYILFSEFAMDLPVALPDTLANIAKAPATYQDLIYSTCDRIRNDQERQQAYCDLADSISTALNLDRHLRSVEQLGKRDTFAFEERRFLASLVKAVVDNQLQTAAQIFEERKTSIWRRRPERSALWEVARRCLKLATLIDEISASERLHQKSVTEYVEFYAAEFYQIDSEFRVMQASTSPLHDTEEIDALLTHMQTQYQKITTKLQSNFLESVRSGGWPAEKLLRHTQIFDKYVESALADKKRVAYFMVDALRFELAKHIYEQFDKAKKKEIIPACAQLPTSTTIGMAALLPKVDGRFKLDVRSDSYDVWIDGKKVNTKGDRETYFQSIFGDRVAFWDLNDIKDMPTAQLKKKIKKEVDLLVVHTQDIDALGESAPKAAKTAITDYTHSIVRALHKMGELGFQVAVISADHGFVLQAETDVGDTAAKPLGTWGYEKRRCLIGTGQPSPTALTFKPEDIGIATNAKDYVVPNGFATFRNGTMFFHEGLSLQECVIPVIRFELNTREKPGNDQPKVILNYRLGKSTKVTTRTPAIDVRIESNQLFDQGFAFSLEAYSNQEKIGEAMPSAFIDPDSKLISAPINQTIQIGLILREDFVGPFEVRAFDPASEVIHFRLNLETDILE